MIRFAVCDDDAFMLEDIAARLSKYMEKKKLACQISSFSGSRDLLECSESFDILFLDIQMEAPDGMETARILRKRGFQGLIIFMTVLKESVFDAFEVQAFDYLVKPFRECRFAATVERAIKCLRRETVKSVIVQKGNACRIIPFSQIVYCEVIGRKIFLHCRGGETIDYYNKLENLHKQLDGLFFKCHRSYLVNLDYVTGYHGGLVLLSEGGEIPLSRLREQELAQALLLHMKERRR